ncbi:Phosphatidylinositol-3-phosphatase [Podosphaera aphanis]|nr:Phosphatidylinositol-3-phosphatase [Podosphaera aphanis]
MALLPYRDINIHASTTQYTFLSPSSPSAPTLAIDRPSGNIRLDERPSAGGKRVSSIAGILGIIKLRLDKYIIVITKAQPVGKLKGHTIYKVVATEILPLRERPLRDHDEDTYLSLLKTFIRSAPMYFSYSLDLTNTFQRQSQADLTFPLWKRADDRFFWNRFIQSDLIDFRISGTRQQSGQQPDADAYILPVIYGMLEIVPTSIMDTPLTFALITRRSRHRAGTRYFSRGIDEQGNVSNFNETEQIFVLNDKASMTNGFGGSGEEFKNGQLKDPHKESQVVSFVQTRGSVPVYWAEVNTIHYIPKLQVRAVESAALAAQAHFEEQVRYYGDNYLVNLVKHTGREQKIKEAYEQIIKLLSSVSTTSADSNGQQDSLMSEKPHTVKYKRHRQAIDRLHYIYFDFHSETKGDKYEGVKALLDQLANAWGNKQYFRGADMLADPNRLEVRNIQNCVVRTNCMDCLDRTNLFQSMLARRALDCQLTEIGILTKGQTFTSDNNFEILFRKLWADNADVISESYSGTGALKTDLTRTGKRTKLGPFMDLSNSITRYLKNNFHDGPRQDAFDLFMGNYFPSTGSNLLFVDQRPLLIQSIPYILAFSIFFVTIGIFTRRLPDAAVLPLRVFIVFWLVVGFWSWSFIYINGMLYVNWPKLNPKPWVTEGYQEACSKARKDIIIGSLVTRHERGLSTTKYTNAEEGKKRIE